MQLTVKTNFPDVQRALDLLGKQMPFALAVSMTRTMQDVRNDLRVEMQHVFDRPTPFTLNSLYLSPATKIKLESTVWLKDDFGTKANFLLPQIEGGMRPQKRFEALLRQRGILASDERTTPGQGAKLDSYGNMSRGQIVQILSQLAAFNLAGASQNATTSRRSKSKRAQLKYFVARQGEARIGLGSWRAGLKIQHLRSGIYAKTNRGTIIPVLIFVKHAGYKARFAFFRVAQQTIDRSFPVRFRTEFVNALKTAKW